MLKIWWIWKIEIWSEELVSAESHPHRSTRTRELQCSLIPNAPPSLLPPTPLMGLSYGEQSLCRVPPSPVHPHEGAPMLSYSNFFIFEAKSLICSLVGAFLWLSRGVASLWCQVCFGSSAVVNLHFSCSNSASVLSSCYSWYQLTWNCLQLEFSENHRFKAGVHVKAVFTSLNTAFLPIESLSMTFTADGKRQRLPLIFYSFLVILKQIIQKWKSVS